MSTIEIIEFNTRPGTTVETLRDALDNLDRELTAIGGFESRTLYRAAGTENGWLLDYRWVTLADAQASMSNVATTEAFITLMALVDAPESMKLTYGVPA
ncbi:hypothetical protein M2272_004102 [Mycobacterium frederiksbergense]|uniref:ABM domain-containing protein n=1 Tax=Mycolicibacterium frederiksbergense TaxID=117567 RepID=A0ABT6L5H1_9MYCO|nr:hypothetical protein [Mycolicibacterium frederiksbergense]MDH6197447.1 hypothetical protein [Mycolicibacterium frederiksbergense]